MKIWIGIGGAICALFLGYYAASMLDHRTRLQRVGHGIEYKP